MYSAPKMMVPTKKKRREGLRWSARVRCYGTPHSFNSTQRRSPSDLLLLGAGYDATCTSSNVLLPNENVQRQRDGTAHAAQLLAALFSSNSGRWSVKLKPVNKINKQSALSPKKKQQAKQTRLKKQAPSVKIKRIRSSGRNPREIDTKRSAK